MVWCERDVYMEPPSELHRPRLVANLNKTMYGTMPVAENCGVNTSAAMALSSVQAIPLYRSELVNRFCHGDDFVPAAAEDQIEIF